MRALFVLLGLLALPSSVLARGNQLTPPGDLSTKPDGGSVAAEIAAALLGDLVGTGVTMAMAIPAYHMCHDCGHRSDQRLFYAMLGTSYLLRPVIVGGVTAGIGRSTGGRGRAHAAMLGALPGSALLMAGWSAMIEGTGDGAGLLLVLAGHLAAIGGSVWAYRYSAEHDPRAQRSDVRARQAARFAPMPFVDPSQRVGGLALTGTF